MNWSIYGWFMLVVGTIRLLGAASGKEPRATTTDERIIGRMFWLSFYMPLIGHLVGWW